MTHGSGFAGWTRRVGALMAAGVLPLVVAAPAHAATSSIDYVQATEDDVTLIVSMRDVPRGDAVELDTTHRHLGTVPDPVLLEVDDLVTTVDGGGDVRLDLGVGHRQQGHADVPPPAQLCRRLGERAPLAEAGGTDEVSGEVAVAEPEPGLRFPVRRQLFLGVPGLARPSPPTVGVDAPAERVHDRVEIGTDAQAEEPDVVGGVRDDAELVIGRHGVPHAGDESGSSEASGQDGKSRVQPGQHRERGAMEQPGLRACRTAA